MSRKPRGTAVKHSDAVSVDSVWLGPSMHGYRARPDYFLKVLVFSLHEEAEKQHVNVQR